MVLYSTRRAARSFSGAATCDSGHSLAITSGFVLAAESPGASVVMDSDGSIFCASAGGSDGAGGETGGVRQADRRKVNKPQKIAAFAFAEIVSFIFDAPTRGSS